jgi:hypothetical protein
MRRTVLRVHLDEGCSHGALKRRVAQRVASIGLAIGVIAIGVSALAADKAQRDFASAEQAAEALIGAMRSNNQPELLRILGPSAEVLIRSGDEVADSQARLRLVNAFETAHRIELEGTSRALMVVGAEQWSLPIPVVQQGERWHFDTDAGKQRILDRRVGRNELSVIRVCREYVAAQREYAVTDRLGNGPGEFAQRFDSRPGKHDGLYWEAAAGETPSPFGPLMAQARTEGYTSKEGLDRPSPYHGYYYRILTRQGAHAPGGAKDYLIDGHMTGGYALLAYPAKWGDSGIMTFVVNQDGIVFEKNLGLETDRLAREITAYDPDLSWGTP